MKTQTPIPRPGKRLALLAALALAGAALAMPALAHDDDDDDDEGRVAVSIYSGYGYNNGYRSHNRYRNRRDSGRYAWLNRVNRYGVRGRIVAWGRGSLQGCFRVKRSGRYYRSPAIVTVRYCQDGYGRPYAVRGSKRLVHYIDPYRRMSRYDYRRPMARY